MYSLICMRNINNKKILPLKYKKKKLSIRKIFKRSCLIFNIAFKWKKNIVRALTNNSLIVCSVVNFNVDFKIFNICL